MREGATIYPRPCDLEGGVRVTCDVGYFSLPRPLCSRLRPDVRDRQTDRQTDRRQTDRRQTAQSLNAPAYGTGPRGYNKAVASVQLRFDGRLTVIRRRSAVSNGDRRKGVESNRSCIPAYVIEIMIHIVPNVCGRQAIVVYRWVDDDIACLCVLKMPLNTNQPTNEKSCRGSTRSVNTVL